jgi:cyclase
MGFAKRIIACLDIRDGRTVKGIGFENIRDAGDPVELAIRYMEQGADELVFLDISATNEKRKTLSALVTKIAREIDIPFTVGGGISSAEDVRALLAAGADKISLNTSAFRQPGLIKELAAEFGSQCIVVAIDAKMEQAHWWVYLNGGREKTDVGALVWAQQAVQLGAGEILLTAMNNDGAKTGFATDITKLFCESLPVPVIASGGAGSMDHFVDVFKIAKADAALAASVFHYGEIGIHELKRYLKQHGVSVRPATEK